MKELVNKLCVRLRNRLNMHEGYRIEIKVEDIISNNVYAVRLYYDNNILFNTEYPIRSGEDIKVIEELAYKQLLTEVFIVGVCSYKKLLTDLKIL